MNLNFTKVEGCGNHFILIDQTQEQVIEEFNHIEPLTPSQIQVLSDSRFGVGADGVLTIRAHPPRGNLSPLYEMIVDNADGSRAEMCGNGLRCVAQYLDHRDLITLHPTRPTPLLTGAGILEVYRDDRRGIGVSLKTPELGDSFVSIIPSSLDRIPTLNLSTYSLGNPHLITYDTEHLKYRKELAPLWEERFPQGINISFAELLSPTSLVLFVHERGCGWTSACGTGACAAVFDGYQRGLFARDTLVEVRLPGGNLGIEVNQSGMMMWGPAREVYVGVYTFSEVLTLQVNG